MPVGRPRKPTALRVIEGARDSVNNSLHIFPETLKGDLHSIRSTIEAHSQSRRLTGLENQSANGLQPVGQWLRVYADGAWSKYHIDRWD